MSTNLIIGIIALGVIILVGCISRYVEKKRNVNLEEHLELRHRWARLMAINWNDINPYQTIILNYELEGKIERYPYFITEVVEERKIVEKEDEFYFPFYGTLLDNISLKSLKRNPNCYAYSLKQFTGWHSYSGKTLYSSSLAIKGWELPTEEEKTALLEQVQVLLKKEGLDEDTILFFQRMEKSLTQKEV